MGLPSGGLVQSNLCCFITWNLTPSLASVSPPSSAAIHPCWPLFLGQQPPDSLPHLPSLLSSPAAMPTQVGSFLKADLITMFF